MWHAHGAAVKQPFTPLPLLLLLLLSGARKRTKTP
jgi:hypothetical protein